MGIFKKDEFDFSNWVNAGPSEIDPDLREAAKQMFAMFTALKESGFEEYQALSLLQTMLASGINSE